MISKKQIINGIGLFFVAVALMAWSIVLISGICLVAEIIVLALNELKVTLSQIAVIFIVSFLISIITLIFSGISSI